MVNYGTDTPIACQTKTISRNQRRVSVVELAVPSSSVPTTLIHNPKMVNRRSSRPAIPGLVLSPPIKAVPYAQPSRPVITSHPVFKHTTPSRTLGATVILHNTSIFHNNYHTTISIRNTVNFCFPFDRFGLPNLSTKNSNRNVKNRFHQNDSKEMPLISSLHFNIHLNSLFTAPLPEPNMCEQR